MNELSSKQEPQAIIPNIATLLKSNAKNFGEHVVFQTPENNSFKETTWGEFYQHINTIALNLQKLGFKKGEKLVLFSRNRIEMLELEMAIMSIGGIAVPIFANFKKETAELLINHSDATWLAIEGPTQLNNLGPELNLKKIFSFKSVDKGLFENLVPFYSLLVNPTEKEVLR